MSPAVTVSSIDDRNCFDKKSDRLIQISVGMLLRLQAGFKIDIGESRL
jgi:hypothetical protein